MIYLGIDHGKAGALAWLSEDGQLLGLEDMPIKNGDISVRALMRIIEPFGKQVTIAAIEPVLTVYRFDIKTKQRKLVQSGKSLVTQATELGYIKALLTVFSCTIREIRASEWQKYFDLHGKKGKTPNVEKAQALFPDAQLRNGRKMLDGRADALLIAEYLRQKEINK